jgi:hypothetical protein
MTSLFVIAKASGLEEWTIPLRRKEKNNTIKIKVIMPL